MHNVRMKGDLNLVDKWKQWGQQRSHITHRVSHIAHHTSHITHRTSHIVPHHTSHHISHITHHTSPPRPENNLTWHRRNSDKRPDQRVLVRQRHLYRNRVGPPPEHKPRLPSCNKKRFPFGFGCDDMGEGGRVGVDCAGGGGGLADYKKGESVWIQGWCDLLSSHFASRLNARCAAGVLDWRRRVHERLSGRERQSERHVLRCIPNTLNLLFNLQSISTDECIIPSPPIQSANNTTKPTNFQSKLEFFDQILQMPLSCLL